MDFSPTNSGVVHFIGIGGIGMSGIATILHDQGYQVSGSDQGENANTEKLRKMGIPLEIGHQGTYVASASIVVISSAIRESNPELVKARALGLPIVRRAEMLAEIMRLTPSIAVAGTHGKTTTTSLLATLLCENDLDPTIVSGGIINAYGTNARLGRDPWVVAEADESDGSFVKLPAVIAIVTNIEPEHMEHYGSEENLYNAFLRFVENVPFYGMILACGDDRGVRTLKERVKDRRFLTYGIHKENDIRVCHLEATEKGMTFEMHLSGHFQQFCPSYGGPDRIESCFLPMFGHHNALNATACMTVGLFLGIDPLGLKKGLKSFQGVKRRFSILGTKQDVTFVDDYAHHPTEIRFVLEGARKLGHDRLIAVVQPHRYTRLNALFHDFASVCATHADEVVVLPVYGAGEPPMGKDHRGLCHAIQSLGTPAHALDTQEDLDAFLKTNTQGKDMVLFMGAGSVTQWAHTLFESFEKQTQQTEKNTGKICSSIQRLHMRSA